MAWTEVVLTGVTGTLSDISFGAGRFVAVGYSGTIVTSADFSAGFDIPASGTSNTIWQLLAPNSNNSNSGGGGGGGSGGCFLKAMFP